MRNPRNRWIAACHEAGPARGRWIRESFGGLALVTMALGWLGTSCRTSDAPIGATSREGTGDIVESPSVPPVSPLSEDPALPDSPGERSTPPSPTGLRVDRERGEVSFPCAFVNPTRMLEVFACHNTGPTHETVVEFDVTGPELYRALRAIGLRSARYWNGTSPSDFQQNQGDRVLVLVRWEYDGETHEYPAESMLLDGPSGFPAFLRGFSVSTRGLLPEERPEKGPSSPEEELREDGEGLASEIPNAVEITLGATNRQSPAFSLLTHPTNLPRMVSWGMPPELDAGVVSKHSKLVENRVPATLIVRRLASEDALIADAQRIAKLRGQTDRVELYDRIRPVANEIDALKAQYEALLGEIRELLRDGLDVSKLSEAEKVDRATRGLELLRKGRWLCARIEERYLTQYAMEEEYKVRWVESQEGLSPEIRDETIVLARDGVAFEPELAAKRVEAASIELHTDDFTPAERRIRLEIVGKEIQLIEGYRRHRLAEANVRNVERRLRALAPSEDYVRDLLEEDLAHFRNSVSAIEAQTRVAKSELRELRAILDGSWDAIRAETLADRAEAKRALEIAELNEQLVQLRAQIRWVKNDLTSGISDRVEGARVELEEAQAKQATIERRIAELTKD